MEATWVPESAAILEVDNMMILDREGLQREDNLSICRDRLGHIL